MHRVASTPFQSSIFWSGVLGWTVASVLKIIVNWRRTMRVDFHYLTSLGGMPSAHSAMVSALTASVGLHEGFGSPIFVVTLAFSLVIMFDASTVRRAAGHQATLLNQIVEVVRNQPHLPTEKLREILGHTRVEVFAGMLVGAAVSLVITVLMHG